MGFIVDSLSYVLGLLMDLFFKGLTVVGYPRLWACTVLFAFVTKLLFLPERINSHKSKLLAPVVKKDLLSADPNFFDKTKDKELTVKRAAIKKQVNKKYKLSNSSGCLTLLIQYPILVALFSVVQNPARFIPSLESMLSTSPEINTFLGLSLSAIPLKNTVVDGTVNWLFLLVPSIIIVSNIIKLLPNFKAAKTKGQKIIIYPLFSLIIILLGWLSSSLPVVISLYWLVGDITFSVFDFFIHKYLPKQKTISAILSQHEQEMKDAANQEPQIPEENKAEEDLIASEKDASIEGCSNESNEEAKDEVL